MTTVEQEARCYAEAKNRRPGDQQHFERKTIRDDTVMQQKALHTVKLRFLGKFCLAVVNLQPDDNVVKIFALPQCFS